MMTLVDPGEGIDHILMRILSFRRCLVAAGRNGTMSVLLTRRLRTPYADPDGTSPYFVMIPHRNVDCIMVLTSLSIISLVLISLPVGSGWCAERRGAR